jgi:hypothetical protein
MPSNETFRHFKQPGKITVSNFRRVAHSANQKRKSFRGDVSGSAWEGTSEIALASATVNAACTIAVAAGAAGAFAVVASGPVAAGALGVVGIMLAAKSTYSNRESAHKELMPYVWSYIDDVAPLNTLSEANRKKAGAAALSLISDGQPQMKLMDSKFKQREKDFNAYWTKYEGLSQAHALFSQGMKAEKVMIAVYNSESARVKHIEKAFNRNGAVYEFMRRLGHMANYMQAPAIFGMVMQKDSTPLKDFGLTVTAVNQVRTALNTQTERMASDEKAYEAVKRVIETG